MVVVITLARHCYCSLRNGKLRGRGHTGIAASRVASALGLRLDLDLTTFFQSLFCLSFFHFLFPLQSVVILSPVSSFSDLFLIRQSRELWRELYS